MGYCIVYVDSLGRFELVTTVTGKNAETRAKEYAKQIIGPNKVEVRAVSWDDYTNNWMWFHGGEW